MGKKVIHALFLAVLGVACVKGAQAASFTDAQKKEIGTIIRQYIMDNPEILFEAADKHRENEMKKEQEKADIYLKDNRDKLFSNPNYFSLGDPKAPIAFVEFYDYNCGYCKRAYGEIVKFLDKEKDVRLVLIDTPILSAESHQAALWSIAAGKKGKFPEFHKALMEFQGPKTEENLTNLATSVGLDPKELAALAKTDDVTKQIEENMKIFQGLGLSGTPGFVAYDQVIRGAADAQVFHDLAAKQRAEMDKKGDKTDKKDTKK